MKVNNWNITTTKSQLSILQSIQRSPLIVEDACWYQCDVIRKDGRRDFLYRFVADSDKRAKIKVFFRVKRELIDEEKTSFYYDAATYFIKTFDIYKVPDVITECYDFNKSEDLERFYNNK